MNLRFLCLLLILLTEATSAGFPQSRANFAWWNSPVRADLKLTEEQSEKIREVVRSYRNRLLDARNSVQKAEGDLEDILNDDHVDAAAAKQIVDRLSGARANASRVSTQMALDLRSVLTMEQWRILVRKHAEIQRSKPPDTQVTP